MRRGILITLLSAVVAGLTAFAVVKFAMYNQAPTIVQVDEGARFRTVNLSEDNWPDFTYAAESAVDAVVYVRVKATETMQEMPSSIFDLFFGTPQQGAPKIGRAHV